MTLQDDIDALTREDLTEVVRGALRDEGVWPVAWQSERLDWAAINPTTSGLFRFTGTADSGANHDIPWMAVLKVVTAVDLSGTPLENGYSREPGDWNYWKREFLVYGSGITSAYRRPLVPVRCLHTVERRGDQVWLWLEALEGAQPRKPWSVSELASAAYDIGAFSAQGVDLVTGLSDTPWVARSWLRGWVQSGFAMGARHAAEHGTCWTNSRLAGSVDASTAARYRDVVAGADQLLETLETLPTTVAHHDLQGSNLFRGQTAGGEPATIAIDWSFLGISPVGADLGHHIGGAVIQWQVSPTDLAAHRVASTEAYLRGLRSFGWDGDPRTTSSAAAATAGLQVSAFRGAEAAWLCDDWPVEDETDRSWPDELAARCKTTVEDALRAWAANLEFALKMAIDGMALLHTARRPG